jgi:hypothetical protein
MFPAWWVMAVATVTMQKLQWETMASMMDCDAHLCGVGWSPKTNKRRSSYLSHPKFTTLGAEEKTQRGTCSEKMSKNFSKNLR